MTEDFLTGLFLGAFIVAMVWGCNVLARTESKARRGERELFADAYDPDAAQRAWLTKTHGGNE